MTPATARAILLHLCVAYVGVLGLWLARDGLRGVRGRRILASRARGTFHEGGAAVRHGWFRLAVGLAGATLAGWLLV